MQGFIFHTIDLSEAVAGHSWYEWWKDIFIPSFAPLVAVIAIGVAVMLTRAQVRPLREQIIIMRDQADSDQRQKRNSIAWSISLEAMRLASAARTRSDATKNGANARKSRLSISVSGLARGDRSDIVLLDADIQRRLAELVHFIDEYNSAVDVIPTKSPEETVGLQGSEAPELLDLIRQAGNELADVIQNQYPNASF